MSFSSLTHSSLNQQFLRHFGNVSSVYSHRPCYILEPYEHRFGELRSIDWLFVSTFKIQNKTNVRKSPLFFSALPVGTMKQITFHTLE